MANAVLGNKIYIDSTGAVSAGIKGRLLISYILFTPTTANDSMTLGESASGDPILFLQGATAKTTMQFRFEDTPLVFQNLYVQAISSGAKATLVTTQAGGG